jgi:hypothetical protein
VRTAVGLSIALGALACETESEIAPRTPIDAQRIDPTCMEAPAIEDSFAQTFARSDYGDYHTERPPIVNLGAIGDTPLGREPTPPHRLAPWEEPFPCDWTNTCRVVPVVCPCSTPYGVSPVVAR